MSRDRPAVGVVVLNYRGLPDTLACLDSLQSSTYPARVVVVDNASGDGSVEQLRTRPGVTVIASDRNLGFGGGCNLGARQLLDDGVDHVWFLNNDTTVDPGALEALVATAETDDGIGAVGSVLYRAEEPDRVLTWGGGSLGRRTAFTFDATGPTGRLDYLTAASLLVRREALEDVGGFDERYFFTWEDVDLCHRIVQHGWRLALAPEARVWHRWGGSAAPLSPMRVTEQVAGAVVFMRSTSAAPGLTTLPLLGRYAYRSVRDRDAGIWRAAWRGWRTGWRRPRHPVLGLRQR